jgi:hypothetical protein
VGLTTLPCKKENCREASKKFSRILWRRPRPGLGCGANERKKIYTYSNRANLTFGSYWPNVTLAVHKQTTGIIVLRRLTAQKNGS